MVIFLDSESLPSADRRVTMADNQNFSEWKTAEQIPLKNGDNGGGSEALKFQLWCSPSP